MRNGCRCVRWKAVRSWAMRSDHDVLRIFASMFRGPLTVLSLRLGAVAIVYSLTRSLFALLNSDIFPNVPLASYLGGMRFDGFAIAWTNLPWVLLVLIHPKPASKAFRAVQLWLFMLLN